MNKTDLDRLETLNKDTKALAYLFVPKADEYLQRSELFKAFEIAITQALRSPYLQAGLYSQGRAWRPKSQVWEVVEPKQVVTWTLESNHITGDAFDIALRHKPTGRLEWPEPKQHENLTMWLGLAEIGKNLGLYPGALWRGEKKDYPHYSRLPG